MFVAGDEPRCGLAALRADLLGEVRAEVQLHRARRPAAADGRLRGLRAGQSGTREGVVNQGSGQVWCGVRSPE